MLPRCNQLPQLLNPDVCSRLANLLKSSSLFRYPQYFKMSNVAKNRGEFNQPVAFTSGLPVTQPSFKFYRSIAIRTVSPLVSPHHQNGQPLRRCRTYPEPASLPFLLPRPLLSSPISPRKCRITAVSKFIAKDDSGSKDDIASSQRVNSTPALLRKTEALWHFSRPHTIYGTVLSVLSVTAVAAGYHGIPANCLRLSLLTSLIPALLLNVYIVGLNQIHDIDIDRINKPNLPLASKAMTLGEAYTTIVLSLLLGLAFCLPPLGTNPLRVVLIGSVILGTLYSAPPFRVKRFAALASACILSVRGVLINIGFFLHATKFSRTMTRPIIPPALTFAAIFFTLFGIIIALLKDVPDIQGDRLFGIRTFSVKLGARTIFNTCVSILVFNFIIAAIFYGLIAKSFAVKILTVVLHSALAMHLFRKSRGVDPSDRAQVTKYYMLSWKAFYTEYLLLPLGIL